MSDDFQFKKAPSNRGLRHPNALHHMLALQFKKAPSNRGLRQLMIRGEGKQCQIQKSPIKSGIKTEHTPRTLH